MSKQNITCTETELCISIRGRKHSTVHHPNGTNMLEKMCPNVWAIQFVVNISGISIFYL